MSQNLVLQPVLHPHLLLLVHLLLPPPQLHLPHLLPQYHPRTKAFFSSFASASRGPLHASIDAKLQTLCQNIAASKKKGAKKPASATAAAATSSSTPTSNCSSSPSSDDASSSYHESTAESSCLSPSPSASPKSSTVPKMQQLNFSEAPWDEAAGFALTKFPSKDEACFVEICMKFGIDNIPLFK
ncbi:ethylene-responsive transcription factor RAP2-4-like [Miscanthus floridulus]|uniref:ethylene-responsive transcription factor RAP2-4-like n=1 Tax=Miscanthus floridulus TaxID=154761 RepID=UPI003457BBFD